MKAEKVSNLASLLFSQQHKNISGRDVHLYKTKEQTSDVSIAT